MKKNNAIPPLGLFKKMKTCGELTQKRPDIAQQILMNGAAYFNEKLFKVFCPAETLTEKVALARKMFEHIISELGELANENITINRDKYYFELADVMFCVFGVSQMFDLNFKNIGGEVWVFPLFMDTKRWLICALTPEQWAIYEDIVNLQITLPYTHAQACAHSNATKFFSPQNDDVMANDPVTFAAKNGLEIHQKEGVCFFTEKLPQGADIKKSTPRKVVKPIGFGFLDKPEVLKKLLSEITI